MHAVLRSALLLLSIQSLGVGASAGALPPSVDIQLEIPQCLFVSCDLYAGAFGSPESGHADFTSIAPWTFGFASTVATSWQFNGGGYFAQFGDAGPGSFLMTGPDGLTFLGEVTSGSSGGGAGNEYVNAAFTGEWSDGSFAYGDASIFVIAPNELNWASLNVYTAVPEPASVLLVCTGLIGAWRKIRH